MIDKLRQAAEMALKAIDLYVETYPHMDKGYMVDARSELRQALVQQKMSDSIRPKGKSIVKIWVDEIN